MVYALAYGVAVLVMAGLDFLWLSNTAGPVYRRHQGAVMAESPDMRAAVAFYVVYIFGILYFAVRPALAAGDWRVALVNGALFGFFAYATYDLTNLATLKSWSLPVSLIDIAWGAFSQQCRLCRHSCCPQVWVDGLLLSHQRVWSSMPVGASANGEALITRHESALRQAAHRARKHPLPTQSAAHHWIVAPGPIAAD